MEKIDLVKLDTAILYVQRIAEGYNPITNEEADEDTVLNNPHVIRCMYFVKNVLEEVRRNDGKMALTKTRSKKIAFPFEVLKEFTYQEDTSISYLLQQIHKPLEGMNVKKISTQVVTNWLKKAGYLTEEYHPEVKKVSTMPTEKGKELGIYTEVRMFSTHAYLSVIYNQNAQEFIVKNLEMIVNGEVVI